MKTFLSYLVLTALAVCASGCVTAGRGSDQLATAGEGLMYDHDGDQTTTVLQVDITKAIGQYAGGGDLTLAVDKMTAPGGWQLEGVTLGRLQSVPIEAVAKLTEAQGEAVAKVIEQYAAGAIGLAELAAELTTYGIDLNLNE
jgi:hypothetical protein